MKTNSLLLLTFVLCNFAYAAEPVTSNCTWRPSDSKILEDLQKDKPVPFCSASRPDECDEMKVKENGRTYFYSLPNKSCKTEIFIINGDQVSAVDFYPERSGVFTDYVKVVYTSKSLKKDISGWVEMKRLCRLTPSGDCP